eukprot:TRINITY_DN11092_c0_g2_i4.p1 TRINITY_DN11092_c0_g2~~TRINITY_DN11092_c0_g2_i4.p1  ORF type:complete len:269 (+),score=88.48 TRINITY_DN11092_c0_g2_i4:430-1236(+)
MPAVQDMVAETPLESLDDFVSGSAPIPRTAVATAEPPDSWPEAAEVVAPKASTGNDWPEANEVIAPKAAQSSAFSSVSPAREVSSSRRNSGTDDVPASAGGLRRFVSELSRQLAEEVRRRETEEAELERRALEKKKLLEELDSLRRRREQFLGEDQDDQRAAAEMKRQHAELAEEHRKLRATVAQQEEELEKMREEAKIRTGAGRDWARDGPEKDALVATKLQIAEAHDELAQLRQQLWLNREGLRKKVVDLQTENARLRASASKILA